MEVGLRKFSVIQFSEFPTFFFRQLFFCFRCTSYFCIRFGDTDEYPHESTPGPGGEIGRRASLRS